MLLPPRPPLGQVGAGVFLARPTEGLGEADILSLHNTLFQSRDKVVQFQAWS